MIELVVLVWALAIFFAYVGSLRGWTKEIIAMGGIILGLFTLHHFDPLIRQVLLIGLPADQIWLIQSILFVAIVFFAYQTRALEARIGRRDDGRDPLQSRALGAIVGFINGYMIGGTIWYFMDINRPLPGGLYPLDPFVVAPIPGSPSDAALRTLPLYVLAQGPGSSGDLLALSVITLFIFVLIMI